MLSSMSTWLKTHLPVLFQEKMPVWMTILFSLAAAGVTYGLVPRYTHHV